MPTNFVKFVIDQTNKFDELANATSFEDITNGRKGAVLVDCNNNLIPIVRTTTAYNEPAQKFLPIHYGLIENIKKVSNLNLEFNNALAEIYESSYRTMGYHSDQSLDLAPNSYICIFSCYDDPTDLNIRKLKIQNKTTNEYSEFLLEHNSFVLFSLSVNANHLHKIVLENKNNTKWLGITFRLSKTFVKFINEIPYIYDNTKILRIANDEDKKEFYKHRAKENQNIEYIYPDLDYTISVSDMMFIK